MNVWYCWYVKHLCIIGMRFGKLAFKFSVSSLNSILSQVKGVEIFFSCGRSRYFKAADHSIRSEKNANTFIETKLSPLLLLSFLATFFISLSLPHTHTLSFSFLSILLCHIHSFFICTFFFPSLFYISFQPFYPELLTFH